MNICILQGFALYMVISGIILYLFVTSIQVLLSKKDDLSESEKEEIERLEDFIYANFGKAFWDIFPRIQLLCLVLGWYLLPSVIYLSITDKEEGD